MQNHLFCKQVYYAQLADKDLCREPFQYVLSWFQQKLLAADYRKK
jgi:hypothetical protein